MATTLAFKDLIDLPQWRPETVAVGASAAGICLASHPLLPYHYCLRSNTAFDAFDPTTGEWLTLGSPALAGTFGAGACMIPAPSQGPRGTLAAGGSTTKIILTTALPAAVGVNQLANRGDGQGFKVRIVNLVSGKTEERKVIANTGGTTPTCILDSPLSFTPALNDLYEFRSGRIYLIGAAVLAAGIFKYYDILTNSFSANLTTANMPATVGTDSAGLHLSEDNVPNDMVPGEGFVLGAGTYNGAAYRCIVATALTNTTNAVVTGAGMPADLQANEYTNFQLRIVEDTTNPTSVGQRKRITSHTAGATGAFTLSGVFTVAPSATAKFVIENDDDKILLRSSAVATVFNYNITAGTWDTTTWAASGSAVAGGCTIHQAYGISRDTSNNARHSQIFCFRGNSVSLDVLDIAGGATGVWANAAVYGNSGTSLGATASAIYDPSSNAGRFIYINTGTQRMLRFDVRNRILDPWAYLRFPQGAACVGQKMAISTFVDGTSKLGFIYHLTHTQANYFSIAAQR